MFLGDSQDASLLYRSWRNAALKNKHGLGEVNRSEQ